MTPCQIQEASSGTSLLVVHDNKCLGTAKKIVSGGWMVRSRISKPWIVPADHFVKAVRGTPTYLKHVMTKREARALLESLCPQVAS